MPGDVNPSVLYSDCNAANPCPTPTRRTEESAQNSVGVCVFTEHTDLVLNNNNTLITTEFLSLMEAFGHLTVSLCVCVCVTSSAWRLVLNEDIVAL